MLQLFYDTEWDKKGCSLLKTLKMLYLLAKVLVSPKTDIWKYFLQIQGAILKTTELILGLFVLKWLHYSCRIWIWQYKFKFLQFVKKKSLKLFALSSALDSQVQSVKGKVNLQCALDETKDHSLPKTLKGYSWSAEYGFWSSRTTSYYEIGLFTDESMCDNKAWKI